MALMYKPGNGKVDTEAPKTGLGSEAAHRFDALSSNRSAATAISTSPKLEGPIGLDNQALFRELSASRAAGISRLQNPVAGSRPADLAQKKAGRIDFSTGDLFAAIELNEAVGPARSQNLVPGSRTRLEPLDIDAATVHARAKTYAIETGQTAKTRNLN